MTEPYFMNQEQKDAVIGRVTREKKDADHDLGLLLSEAKRVAGKFRVIASLLEDNPQSLIFEDEPLNARLGPWQNRILASDLDWNALKKLAVHLSVAIKTSKEKTVELEGLLR